MPLTDKYENQNHKMCNKLIEVMSFLKMTLSFRLVVEKEKKKTVTIFLKQQLHKTKYLLYRSKEENKYATKIYFY